MVHLVLLHHVFVVVNSLIGGKNNVRLWSDIFFPHCNRIISVETTFSADNAIWGKKRRVAARLFFAWRKHPKASVTFVLENIWKMMIDDAALLLAQCNPRVSELITLGANSTRRAQVYCARCREEKTARPNRYVAASKFARCDRVSVIFRNRSIL